MVLRPLIAGLMLLFSLNAVADTQVITLKNRTSADLLPVAQKFIGKDGNVSVYGNQLIVEAPSEKIQSLEALLRQLDKPARRLLITVDTSQCDGRFCGRLFDAGLLAELPPDVDPCGENGEFHTLVTDMPGFNSPLTLLPGEIDRSGRFHVLSYQVAG